jgi:dihydrofolate reductase
MRKLTTYNTVTLDGYFTSASGDMSWAHRQDPEWMAFVAGNASGESVMVFGRKTYELMASYWPTPQAHQNLPLVARRMNESPKVVFSRTLDTATWSNTTLVKGDLVEEMRKLKQASGPDMVIMGSGTIVSQLSQARLIDQYMIVLSPIALGAGRTLFEGMQDRLALKLTKSQSFSNGNVVSWYEPAA